MRILVKIRVSASWPKMPKFGDLSSKSFRANNIFEISTVEIEYMQNFVKIRKLILFGPKCPILGILTQNF